MALIAMTSTDNGTGKIIFFLSQFYK